MQYKFRYKYAVYLKTWCGSHIDVVPRSSQVCHNFMSKQSLRSIAIAQSARVSTEVETEVGVGREVGMGWY